VEVLKRAVDIHDGSFVANMNITGGRLSAQP
jgi:hypothetical protein